MAERRDHEIPGSLVLLLLASGLLPAPVAAAIKEALAGLGISPDTLAQPDARVPVQQLEPLFAAMAGLSLPLIALRLGEQVRLTSHGRLGLLLMTSATMREACQVLGFLPLITTAASLHLIEGEVADHLFIQPQTTSALINEVLVYYTAAAIRRLGSLLTGSPPAAVMHIAGPRPAGFDHQTGIDPAQWRFDAPAHCLVFSKEFLDRPILFSDPVTRELTLRKCEKDLLALRRQMSVRQKVGALLEHCRQYPRQEEVAAALNMSTRTLKRRLVDEGSGFNELLREARRLRAIHLLTATSASCQTIADQLGFSSQTNFTHAFKKWTGLAPRAFRERG